MANHASHASLPFPIKNARFTVLVPFLDADGDPTDPTTPDTEFSGDGGAFGDCAEEVSTITGSNGCGYITLTGAETNYSMVALAFKVASGPKATLMTLYPQNLPTLHNGTATAGAAGTITLQSTAPSYDITGCFVRTTGGTGGGGTGGASNQARKIVGYNAATKVATISPNWETNPSSDTTYDILLDEAQTLAVRSLLQSGIVDGICTTGGSTTSIVTSSLSPAAAATDQFKGRIVVFDPATTTANLRGQGTRITASTSGGVLTVEQLSDAPASGDRFRIF